MTKLIINTGSSGSSIVRKDGNQMSGKEWIDYQLSQGEYISGKGVVDFIKQTLTEEIVGCEVGVCLGPTSKYIMENLKNVKKLYCVDSYPEYVDWNGIIMNREKQDAMKQFAYENLKDHHDRIEFVYDLSSNFAKTMSENSLDFVFVDADHSYKGALDDFKAYFPLVKKGGVFAGHDFSLAEVNKALSEFLGEKISEVQLTINNAWYMIK